MTRAAPCAICQRSPAKKAVCCAQRLCAEHELKHPCQRSQELLAMTPAQVRAYREAHAPEERLTTEAIDEINKLPGVEVRRTKRRQGSRRSDELDGVPDITGDAGVAIYVEMKSDHPDSCDCKSCAAQRDFAMRAEGRGAIVVMGARTVQAAVDGVRMGLARARGSRRQDCRQQHDTVQCLRCGHKWESRLPSGQAPKQCGLCLGAGAAENGEAMIVALPPEAKGAA